MEMTPPLLTLSVLAALVAGGAAAAEPKALTYEEFEVSVPHFDLADCPPPMASPETFCRASFHADAVHVFQFSDQGDQPLVAFRSFDEDGYRLTLN
jgi:hypothetical protein